MRVYKLCFKNKAEREKRNIGGLAFPLSVSVEVTLTWQRLKYGNGHGAMERMAPREASGSLVSFVQTRSRPPELGGLFTTTVRASTLTQAVCTETRMVV